VQRNASTSTTKNKTNKLVAESCLQSHKMRAYAPSTLIGNWQEDRAGGSSVLQDMGFVSTI
jgi:hypothetical protein